MDVLPHRNIATKLPLYLRQQAEVIARTNGVSLNHFVSTAIEEKIDRLLALEQRHQQSASHDQQAAAG